LAQAGARRLGATIRYIYKDSWVPKSVRLSCFGRPVQSVRRKANSSSRCVVNAALTSDLGGRGLWRRPEAISTIIPLSQS